MFRFAVTTALEARSRIRESLSLLSCVCPSITTGHNTYLPPQHRTAHCNTGVTHRQLDSKAGSRWPLRLSTAAEWQPDAWSPMRCMQCIISERWPQALMHAARQTKASCMHAEIMQEPQPRFHLSPPLLHCCIFPLPPVQRRSFSCLARCCVVMHLFL